MTTAGSLTIKPTEIRGARRRSWAWGLGFWLGLGWSLPTAHTVGDEPDLVPPLIVSMPEKTDLDSADVTAVVTAAQRSPTETLKVSGHSLEDLGRWITQLARHHLPHTYRDDRKWGGTTQRWDGVKVELDGLRLDTERRWKEVNHGQWQRYEVQLLDPQREFVINLQRLETDERGRLKMTIDVSSAVKVHGRVAKWNRGVQLYSIGADARAKLRATLDLTLEVALVWSEVPPMIIFRPTVDRAQLELVDFELDRIGEIGGDLAEGIGKAARSWLEERLRDHQSKLVAKLQRAIDRREDDLRVSVSELIETEWGKRVARHVIPASAAQAVPSPGG